MADETKPCPRCGKRMILIPAGVIYPTDPPRWPHLWWCGCGHCEPGPTLREGSRAMARRAAWRAVWERANGERSV